MTRSSFRFCCNSVSHSVAPDSGEVVSLFGEFGITADTSGVPALDLDALKAVETCNVDKMQLLLEGLGESETQRILSKGVDETGRQLLHVASSQGGEDAADMVRLLLEHGAPVNAADFIGETPLSLAIAVVTESDHSDSTWAALDTIRVLLVAGANNVSSLLLAELEGRSNEEELCQLCRLLQAFGLGGSDAPEASQDEKPTDLEQQCQEEAVPLEKLGSLGAKAVLGSCAQWRQMNVKQLRSECAEVGIPTDGCVEKGEVIEPFGTLI